MDTMDIAPAATPATVAFNEELGALTASLGDPTRRGIFLAVRGAEAPVTVGDVAASFGLHPNVARHHLDKLVADGWLRVAHRRRGKKSGPGAGRPAKHYEPTAREVSLQFPQRRYELLAELLVRTLERIDPIRAGELAEEVGREYGRQLAADMGVTSHDTNGTISLVVQAMLGLGFETTGSTTDQNLITSSCPFAATADGHQEIVCRLDKGIVRGLAGDVAISVALTPRRTPDEVCITEF